jgi:hypothetical protein
LIRYEGKHRDNVRLVLQGTRKWHVGEMDDLYFENLAISSVPKKAVEEVYSKGPGSKLSE